MSRLHVDIEKRLDTFDLRVQLEVGAEIMVLFGPSGAGKTTTLESIAGLVSPDAGEIRLDRRVFFRRGRPGGERVDLAARKRGVGYVFQDYALFPHLTAERNIGFSLRGEPDRGRGRARELLESMHIPHLAERYPREMSGGQQQRVALARALASRPEILLLDEPFAAMERAMRERLQRDLRTLQADLGLVVLCVTHDLEDAFAVGDRIAVLNEGAVEQVGRVEDVLRRPTERRAAEVVGVRNVFHARVVDATADGVVLDWDGLRVEAAAQHAQVGERVPVYIRPDDVKVMYPDRSVGEALRSNRHEGTVTDHHVVGDSVTLRVLLSNRHEIELRFPGYTYSTLPLAPGTRVGVCLRRDSLLLLPPPEAVSGTSPTLPDGRPEPPAHVS